MKGWTNDDRMMITCCNDGTRPVIFKIECINIPENDEERVWLAKQNFKNTAEDAVIAKDCFHGVSVHRHTGHDRRCHCDADLGDCIPTLRAGRGNTLQRDEK